VINASCRPYGRGANATVVTLGPLTVWFSYQTVVAFQAAGGRRYVSQNHWSTTTGRHLNEIDGGDKAGRLGRAEFEAVWAEVAEPACA
jgi:hypothetical protein